MGEKQIQPSPEVVAARAALDEERRILVEISPVYPSPLPPPEGDGREVFMAYIQRLHKVRFATWDLYAAIDKHYEELTGLSTRRPPRELL